VYKDSHDTFNGLLLEMWLFGLAFEAAGLDLLVHILGDTSLDADLPVLLAAAPRLTAHNLGLVVPGDTAGQAAGVLRLRRHQLLLFYRRMTSGEVS
jgi:hypothetical protein